VELKHINELEKATRKGRAEMLRFGMALLFVIFVMLYASMQGVSGVNGIMLVIAAVIGAYMAMNIGANDVANNVGPAVGSRAMTLTMALFIAAIFEALGAIVAGGEVIGTIRNGIINPALIPDADTFVWLMMAALLAAALWLNVATITDCP